MRKHLTRGSRGRLARRLVAASSAAVVVFGAPLASASAAPAAAGAVDLLSAEQQSALDYWTPERMAGARSVGQVVDQVVDQAVDQSVEDATGAVADVLPDVDSAPTSQPRSTLAAGDAPVVGRDTRSVSDLVTGEAVSVGTTWKGETVGRVGRLYFKQGAFDYECTASSVDSPGGNVIVTAGHCITEGDVRSTELVFVPGLAGSSQPYGKFAVEQTFTTREWETQDQTSAAALNYDVGFARVSTLNGRTLEETVGSFDISFSADLGRVTVFGYPGRSTNSDGYTLQYCTGLEFTDASAGDATTDRATLCNMAGGSSGGPWLRDFDAATGGGTVTSVVSFSYNTAPEVLYGPLFGTEVRAVYALATA